MMQPTPHQVKQNVLVGPFQPPPPRLMMPGRGNGLLEDLIIFGHRPIPVIIVWDMGLIQQNFDTNYTTEVSS